MSFEPRAVKHGLYRAPGSGGGGSFATLAAGTMRVTVLEALPRAMWVRGIGWWGGRQTATAVTLRGALLETNQNHEPMPVPDTDDTRMAYTDAKSITTSMTTPSGGEQYESDFDASSITFGPGTVSVLLPAGYRPGVGLLPTVATFGQAYMEAETISADNEHRYELLGLSQPPPENIADIVDFGEWGQQVCWIYGEWNEAPQNPVNRTATGLATLTPALEWDFRDNNGRWGGPSENNSGSNVGDRVGRVHVQVRDKATKAVMWAFQRAATTEEVNSDHIVVVIPEDAELERDREYQFRCRHQDLAESWSDWGGAGTASEWIDFTISEFGTLTVRGEPDSTIGQILGIEFQGWWTHTEAEDMEAVRLQLLTRQNVVIKTSPVLELGVPVPSSASPGTMFTVDQVDADFNGYVDWATTYKYRMQGRDESGRWSSYSARRQFRTNVPPTIPTDLRPDGTNHTGTPLPTLSCICTDPDDTPGTGFVVEFEITRPNDTTIERDAVYNPLAPNDDGTLGRWEYPLVSGDLVGGSEFGEYAIRSRGFDGSVYSGGSATGLIWSDVASFDYVVGPTVTMVSPTQNSVVATTAIEVAWTSSTAQVDFHSERIIDAATGKQVYPPPGSIAPAVERTEQTFTAASGTVKNGGVYDLYFTYVDAGGQWPIGPIRFSVDYVAPADVSPLSVLGKRIGNDPFETAILVEFGSTLLGDAFGGYRIYSRNTGDPIELERLRAELSNPSDTQWLDLHPPSGIDQTYRVTQFEIKDSSEIVESDGVEGAAMIVLGGTVLVSVTNPSIRCHFQWFQSRTYRDTLVRKKTRYDVVGGGPPVTIVSPNDYWATAFVAEIVDETILGGPVPSIRYADIVATLAGAMTVSIRNERGMLRFVEIDSCDPVAVPPHRWTVSMGVSETRWTPDAVERR